MAEADAPKRHIGGRSEEELMRELTVGSNAVLLPAALDAGDRPAFSPDANTMNKLISTVYSGPTIGDVEAALAVSCGGSCSVDSGNHGYPRSARIALPEKGFNKMEGKFTVRVNCSSNGMADDGYKWRKYGQKSIKNSPHPRSYYRCTNPRCNAKKQVERSAEDPETLVVTYEGLHLHYAFSHFLLPRPCTGAASVAATAAFPSSKRPKVDTGAAIPQLASTLHQQEAAPAAVSFTCASRSPAPALAVPEGGRCSVKGPRSEETDAASGVVVQRGGEAFSSAAQSSVDPPEGGLAESARGLLEDVVPGLVWKPCGISTSGGGAVSTVLSDPASLLSAPSSPPSSAPSSPFPWPLFDDLGILSVPSSPASSSSSASFSWAHDPSLFDMAILLAGPV